MLMMMMITMIIIIIAVITIMVIIVTTIVVVMVLIIVILVISMIYYEWSFRLRDWENASRACWTMLCGSASCGMTRGMTAVTQKSALRSRSSPESLFCRATEAGSS